MSDNSIWGKTYRRFVENGYDQGYAAYRADEAERELRRKAKKGDVARLIGDHIADKNDVIEKLRAENERLRRDLAAQVGNNEQLAMEDVKVRWLLNQIITHLPANRDWLDPDVEREARDTLASTPKRPS